MESVVDLGGCLFGEQRSVCVNDVKWEKDIDLCWSEGPSFRIFTF